MRASPSVLAPLAARTKVKKDTLINLYWILDSVQKGTEPDLKHVSECFISIRDELMLPDTEEIVVHIREAWEQSQVAADVLANQLIGSSRRKPLPDHQLIELMGNLAAVHRLPVNHSAELAVGFGRLVEAAHGIKP